MIPFLSQKLIFYFILIILYNNFGMSPQHSKCDLCSLLKPSFISANATSKNVSCFSSIPSPLRTECCSNSYVVRINVAVSRQYRICKPNKLHTDKNILIKSLKNFFTCFFRRYDLLNRLKHKIH